MFPTIELPALQADSLSFFPHHHRNLLACVCPHPFGCANTHARTRAHTHLEKGGLGVPGAPGGQRSGEPVITQVVAMRIKPEFRKMRGSGGDIQAGTSVAAQSSAMSSRMRSREDKRPHRK
eukprot:521229-Pelagomonas_calceolata.AAC.2